MDNKIELRSVEVVSGPNESVHVRAMTTEAGRHQFKGTVMGAQRLPELSEIVDKMADAGYVPTRDLTNLHREASAGGTRVFFKRAADDPDAIAIKGLTIEPTEPKPIKLKHKISI